MTVSRALDCGANGPSFEIKTLRPLYGENLRPCANCERIGKCMNGYTVEFLKTYGQRLVTTSVLSETIKQCLL